jgi:hypothetical protein
MINQDWWFGISAAAELFLLNNAWAKYYQVDTNKKLGEMKGEY